MSAETGGEKAMRGYIFACNLGHEFGYRCAADPPEGIQCAIAGCNSTAVPVREDTEGESREPGKLNNAPDPLDYFLVTYGFDGNNHARQMLISCWAAARQYERKQAAESSLSPPPPKENE